MRSWTLKTMTGVHFASEQREMPMLTQSGEKLLANPALHLDKRGRTKSLARNTAPVPASVLNRMLPL